MPLKIKRYPFYVGIATLIVFIVVVLTGLFLWISHRESKIAAFQTADRLFSEINAKVLQRYEGALESVAVLADSAARMPGMTAPPVGGGLTHAGMELMLSSLDFNDELFSVYVGYDDGTFIQIAAIRENPEVRRLFEAPEKAFFVLRTISADTEGALKQRWLFLDRQRRVVGERSGLDPDYDPRTRPWYIRANRETTAFYTRPYIFSSTRLPGITCAERLIDGGGVFGADITLEQFSRSLKNQKVSDNGMLFLFDRSGRIIAHPTQDAVRVGANEALAFIAAETSDDPRVRSVVADVRKNPDGNINYTREIRIDGIDYLVRSTPIKADLKFDQILASIAPVSDFTGHIRRMQQRVFLFSGLLLLLVLPLVLLVSKRISRSLILLEVESRKIGRRDFSESAAFDSSIKEIHALIRAFALMKRTIRKLLKEQRKLFSDLTKLIAGAIDAKSPYTGGHCARVPELAKMLADTACDTAIGPLADFSMETEDQRWEFEVAAWLHDCGKVTTPEFVVDKATKLETITNRIHEIRMRFEVLLRDAEIDYYRGRLAGDEDEVYLRERLEEDRRRIAEDFSFVAQCNIGGEIMADEKIERLERIASTTWVRYLDDRIGISKDEALLKNSSPVPSLPVVEPLLADKPEHIVPRPQPAAFMDNGFGFKMAIPENQYNLGELYNLSIRKGTLSPEDRFKINEHIIQTIIMLAKLDFPEYLQQVPEFAGAHHETMDGTGYPRGLRKEEMSVQARIIAIADIFEALTAADRPYKTPKTVNEALGIMSRMRDDAHIDADLFDLFLEGRVFEKYARQYLAPEQLGVVDIDGYRSTATR
jgi:HD-GYP domain-containing protein (c-di-GMP phosphodiesterase class II)